MKDASPAQDVIERLDSLVLGTPLSSLEDEVSSQASGSSSKSISKNGILKDAKRDRSAADKKRSITFPDYEELQEIIGYGGDMYYDSDDENTKEQRSVRSENDPSEELTQEERNVQNITKKNTSFNSRPQNLKDPSSSPVPKLGVDKKHTPIISVRPFVREHTPGKVNMVSPMINGEVVISRLKKDNLCSVDNKIFGAEESGGRGEIKTKTHGLGSDGSTENSSSDSDSNTRDSPSPTDFDLKNRENVSNVTEGELLYKKQQSFLSSQIDEQKTKSLAPNGRSSFLNAGAKSNLSSHKVKTINYMDEPTQTILSAANSKLSVLDKSSVPPDDDGSESNKTAGPGEKVVATSSPAAARLSFLKSTIGGARPGGMTTQEFVEDNDETELAKTDGQAGQAENRAGGLAGSAKVLLTRKSPSVASSFASTSIVRGTQKPMITRKPAILKDKPKVPLKPNKLTLRSPSSSPSPSPSPTSKNSPVAAPRCLSVSFRQARENLNIDSKAPGDETKLEETSSVTVMSLGKKESETTAGGKEQNNSLIISVSSAKTELNDPDFCDSTESSKTEKVDVAPISESENSPPQVQKNLAIKNKEALEAIRKSLSNKLISTAPPKIVKESIAALEGPGVKSLGSKPEFNKTSSNSFEENRASIADALQFNRHDNVARPSTKRQAPRPPNDSEEMDELFDVNENEEKSNEKNSVNGATTLDEVTSNETESFAEPKPAIRNSSMKSEHSVKNKDSKARTVQFSPETVTVTLPSTGSGGQTGQKVMTYNNWMVKYQNHYLESSFTGQPITMYPPGVMGPGMKKPGLGYSQPPIVDDGPRKWTEKKNKWRSKSTPRSSEIDEIIGSSKTKSQNKLAIFMPSSSPGPIRRQSRVEIYESEKKNLVGKKSGKFSLRKLFKIQGLPDGLDDNVDVKFLDRDHEREILERQQKTKLRPEIIHPLDLLNSGVEVVKITPKVQGKSENLSSSKLSEISPVKIDADTKPGLATKFNSDCKDSGHDTASIQTETSEEATSISNEESSQSQSVQSSGEDQSASQLTLGVNSVGKPKPLPPPRSQSLETFPKKEGHYDEDEEDGSSKTSRITVPVKPPACSNLSDQHQHQSQPAVCSPKTKKNLDLPETTTTAVATNLTIFHAQTSSIAGSINSEAMSDSTLSFPSSSSARKILDGSEADSERDSVSPQQRLHDETLYTDEHSPVTTNRKRVSRLSMRKGRSIVHKNLEDNYGAVITANHEAIAQILEQVCQNRPTPSSLKTLASALNLKFADFSVLSESEGLRTTNRAFFPATWGSSHLPVTLMISKDMTLSNANVKNSFSLTPIAQFVDEVPSYLLPAASDDNISGNNQAVVWILSRSHVLQFGSYARNLKQRRKSLRVDEFEKDMSFVLLQLINGLKYLQAQGIEETVSDLDNFLLARSDNDNYHRLIITEECHRGSGRKMSLCQCALAAMLQLFDISDPVQVACEPREMIELPQIIPSVSMFKTMAVILQKDGGVSLGQVKSMLEYMLWGPSDIIFDFKMSREAESREEALQRWLDLERATVLNNIIRTQGLWNIFLTVYEEYHLLFLVRTCAKMLREASLLFESKVSRM